MSSAAQNPNEGTAMTETPDVTIHTEIEQPAPQPEPDTPDNGDGEDSTQE